MYTDAPGSPAQKYAIPFLIAICLLQLPGCAQFTDSWQYPEIVEPQDMPQAGQRLRRRAAESAIRQVGFDDATSDAASSLTVPQRLLIAEQDYAAACAMLTAPESSIVEAFYVSTLSAMEAIERTDANTSKEDFDRLADLYHASLLKFIQFAEEYGRRDPEQGILIQSSTGDEWVAIEYHGFAWQPEDFSDLMVADTTPTEALANYHRRPGWGVPLNCLRWSTKKERHHAPNSAFAATAFLRPSRTSQYELASKKQSTTLHLFEPRTFDSFTDEQNQRWELAADFTAPWAWKVSHKTSNRVLGFRQPDTGVVESSLTMVEPYQPGKIPVIFVHGLLSDPSTWISLVNELSANPRFHERYQIFAFTYPTGKAFLTSAAEFRRELATLMNSLWDEYQDPALHHTVLVGHSMGGILSRFQVTYSDDQVWDSYANQPHDSIRMPPSWRESSRYSFFFEPSPFIERVVFIGTPHKGSSYAQLEPKWLTSKLIRRTFQDEYNKLYHDNPGVLNEAYAGRIPTSIDLLIPNNPILNALNRLRYSPRVKLHSIIGNSHNMIGLGPGDGAVPVKSAQLPNTESELFVDAKHAGMQHHPDTVREVERILDKHWFEFVNQYEVARQQPNWNR